MRVFSVHDPLERTVRGLNEYLNGYASALTLLAREHPVPPGRTSATVLMTNLANGVQPIIRYAPGDRVLRRPDPAPPTCEPGGRFRAVRTEG
jgi:hypothetical protein